METPEQHYCGAFIVNFELLSYLFIVFLSLTSSIQMFTGTAFALDLNYKAN